MKRIIYILGFILLGGLTLQAQKTTKPETIQSFAKVRLPIEWYKTQLKLWKAEVDKNQKNAEAWYNYFKVQRILHRLDEDDKRTHEVKEKELTQIVEDMSKAIPNTFEYHHTAWILAGLGDMDKLHHLEKAIALQPDNPALFHNIINMGELTRDTDQRNTYSRKLYNDPETSPGFLYYCHNMLAGLDENAILVTVGDNDTYPVWMLQAEKGIRKDVTAVNSSLILVKEYREKLFKELGVENIKYDPFENKENMLRFENELVSLLASNNQNRPVYITISCGKTLTEKHQDKLYLTGLCYLYCEKTYDNIAALKKNFERNYTLDYLDNAFYHDKSAFLVKQLNTNYIVPMVKLYEHYKLAGETQKANELKAKALAVVSGTENEQQIKKYFTDK